MANTGIVQNLKIYTFAYCGSNSISVEQIIIQLSEAKWQDVIVDPSFNSEHTGRIRTFLVGSVPVLLGPNPDPRLKVTFFA
jgi:hypothetical protein